MKTLKRIEQTRFADFFLYKWYDAWRDFLYRLPPEVAHRFALNGLFWMHRLHLLRRAVPQAPVRVMGLHFENPIGLAAGLDKDGRYVDALACLGFGFIEVGTITPRPQLGNPKPRLFRLQAEQALINCMGFNSRGLKAFVAHCQRTRASRPVGLVLGINLGKQATTPMARAIDDYSEGLSQVYAYADYITINISSPNTVNLRTLQYGKQLDHLLETLKRKQQELATKEGRHVPLVLKISPDLDRTHLTLIAQAVLAHGWEGMIATNTTTDRSMLDVAYRDRRGGLSGKPLFPLSYRVVKALAPLLKGRVALIAVGGIMAAEQADAYFREGVDLVQLYTGFIYHGPPLIKKISELSH